jgi:chromosome segregation ATPase
MWNPPTGPPNDVRLRPAEARRQIAEAIEAAQARDRELREEISVLTTRRVELTVELAAAADDEAKARDLAKRALVQSGESARAGHRAQATRWDGAARVFALRMRDARARIEALEAQLPETAATIARVRSAMVANAAHLNQVAVARLATLNARKAARLQEAVEDAKAEVSAPVDFLVAASEREARAALEAAGALAAAAPPVPVDDDDLEGEVDLSAADALLDELRAELAPDEPVAEEASPDEAAPDPDPDEATLDPEPDMEPDMEEPAPPPATDGDKPARPARARAAGRR